MSAPMFRGIENDVRFSAAAVAMHQAALDAEGAPGRVVTLGDESHAGSAGRAIIGTRPDARRLSALQRTHSGLQLRQPLRQANRGLEPRHQFEGFEDV